jgi:SNF2 family DNA or RNA helicase
MSVIFSYDDDFIYLQNVLKSDSSMMEVYHNAVWSKAKQRWRLPKTHWVCSELWQTFPELRTNQTFLDTGRECKQEFDKQVEKRSTPPSVTPNDKLRPYQRHDVTTLSHMEAAGIFNEPRTGKSIISLSTCKAADLKKNCIVCPASLTLNWAQEIQKWEMGVPFVAVGSRAARKKVYEQYKNAAEGYLIISYETLRSDLAIVEKL